MSIDNLENFSQPNTKNLYADYKFGDSSYRNPGVSPYSNVAALASLPSPNDDVFTRAYFVPLDSVRNSISMAEDVIYKTKQTIENNLLGKIFVDTFVDPDLEQAHFKVWDELSKYIFKPPSEEEELVFTTQVESSFSDIIGGEGDVGFEDDEEFDDSIVVTEVVSPAQVKKDLPPNYICFDEIVFAEKHGSTACRKLVTEYNEAIALTTFSYFFQIRKLLDLFLHEIACIKYSLISDFGDQYENESQQQVALQYDSWAKAAIHYTRRITKIITTKSEQLPSSEVDKISKKQAAQFQAFFAVRLNAVDSEINDILGSLKRDMIDNCDIFYSRYLGPALKMNKDISEPFEFDFVTTNFQKEYPMLAGELLVATNTLQGNFVAIHADLLERMRMMTERVDGLLMLIHEKKRYANLISQLGNRAVQKTQVLKTVSTDVYSQFFRSAPIDVSRDSSLISNHGGLDGLDEDSHPQYLLKDGGLITGNIRVNDGMTIDGVDISEHRHSGQDGSARISILDIDFSRTKESQELVENPFAVSIEGFVPDIIDGGIPVFDVVVAIDIGDEVLSGYEYEILYTEIES